MDPTGAEDLLAPGPELFPAASVHAPHKAEGKTLKPIQRLKLCECRLELVANFLRPVAGIMRPQGCFTQSKSILLPDGEQ